MESRPQKHLPDWAQSHTVLPGLCLLKSSSQVSLRSEDRRARSITGDFYDSWLRHVGL